MYKFVFFPLCTKWYLTYPYLIFQIFPNWYSTNYSMGFLWIGFSRNGSKRFRWTSNASRILFGYDWRNVKKNVFWLRSYLAHWQHVINFKDTWTIENWIYNKFHMHFSEKVMEAKIQMEVGQESLEIWWRVKLTLL